MALSLKQLSLINNRTKYTVYGWIRVAETELSFEFISSITFICILYYAEIGKFHISGANIKLSDDGKIMTKTGKNRHFSFNQLRYQLSQFQWTNITIKVTIWIKLKSLMKSFKMFQQTSDACIGMVSGKA